MTILPSAAMIVIAAVGLGSVLTGKHVRSARSIAMGTVMLAAMVQHATGLFGIAGALVTAGILIVTAPLCVFGRTEGMQGLHRALLGVVSAYLLIVGSVPTSVAALTSNSNPAAHDHANMDIAPSVLIVGLFAIGWTSVLALRAFRDRDCHLAIECASMGLCVAVMAGMVLA